jgi:hypothetical protein
MIEIPTFQQILEMDDDEDERDFSKSIVYDFFEQAEHTFEQMQDALYVHRSRLLLPTGIWRAFCLICSRANHEMLKGISRPPQAVIAWSLPKRIVRYYRSH